MSSSFESIQVTVFPNSPIEMKQHAASPLTVHDNKNKKSDLKNSFPPEDKNNYPEPNVKLWHEKYFQKAVRAIEEANPEKLLFLLGPNLLTLNDLFDSAKVLKKFRNNDKKLVDEFYATIHTIVTGFQKIIKMGEVIATYVSDVLPETENAIKLSRAEKIDKFRKEQEAIVKRQQEGIAMVTAPQFTLAIGNFTGEKGIQSTEDFVRNFKKAQREYEVLRLTLYKDEQSILDFDQSKYSQIMKLIGDRPGIESKCLQRLAQLRFNSYDPNASTEITALFKKILFQKNKILVDALLDNLKAEITALKQRKDLTHAGIADSYATPIQKDYAKELHRLEEIFINDLSTFEREGRYQDLDELLILSAKRKDEAYRHLTIQQHEDQDSLPTSSQQQLEQEYKQQAECWLAKQEKAVADNLCKETITDIIASQIGFVSFHTIKEEKEGNTLLHYTLLECRKAKNDAVRLSLLMTIFSHLLMRSASVYARNSLGQTAQEYAVSKAPNPSSPSAKAHELFHETFTWTSLIKTIDAISTYTPIASRVKTAVLEYSRKNEEKIANWNIVDTILYNRTITAIVRLNEVAKIGQLLHIAQEDISDRLLEDGINALKLHAPKGLLRNRSTLYEKLQEVFQRRGVVYIPFTKAEIQEHMIAERDRKQEKQNKIINELQIQVQQVKEELKKRALREEQERQDREQARKTQQALLELLTKNQPQLSSLSQTFFCSLFSKSLNPQTISPDTMALANPGFALSSLALCKG